jgi:hypothetical protein
MVRTCTTTTRTTDFLFVASRIKFL